MPRYNMIASETHIYQDEIEAPDEVQAREIFITRITQGALETNDVDNFQIDYIEELNHA